MVDLHKNVFDSRLKMVSKVQSESEHCSMPVK